MPKLIHLPGGLVYAQCDCFQNIIRKRKDRKDENHKIRFHQEYAYLGSNDKSAIESWNFGNRKINK